MCHLYHDERSQQQKQQQQQPVMSENIHREVKKMSRISVLSDIEYKPPPTPALESYKHKKFHRHDRDDLSDCQSEHKGDDSSAASHSSSSSSKSPPASASQHQRLSSTSSNDEPASQNNNILIKQESPSPPMAPVAAQVAAVVAASNLGVLRPNMSSHTRPTFGSEASSFRRVSPSSGSNPHTRGPDFIPPGMAVAAAAAAQYNGVGHYPFYNLNPPPHGPYPLVNLPPHLQPHATALHNPHHPLHVTAPPQHRLALGANAGPAPHHRLHANPFSPSTHTLQLLQQQGTSLERIPEIVSNVPPYPFSSSRNSPSPSISSRSSIDGGAMSGLDGSGGPNRITCSGSRKRKKQEDIPDWVKVDNIEDFKRLCEMNCQNDDQIKEMTELRRKIKNRDAAQRSRQKRIETTKKLKDENDSLQDMHKEVKQRYEEKLRENEDIKKKILQKEQEKEYFLQRKRVRLCQQV